MKKIIRTILSLMATIGIVTYAIGANAQGQRPDLSRDMSVTVSASQAATEMLAATQPQDGTICYDLYKIAEVEGSDFNFKTVDKYSSLTEELRKASRPAKDEEAGDWTELAQHAFALTIGEEGSAVNEPTDATYTGLTLDVKNQISEGLYLLVARGTLEDTTVVKTVSATEADGEGHYNGEQLASYMLLGNQVYTVLPQIICVPTKVTEDGRAAASTLADGEWVYDQKIVLKMMAEPATGSIQIDKKLVGYYGTENATFVFQVDTYYPTETELYASEVYSMTFTAQGNKSLLIEGLPIGASVHVSEIYSGLNYTSSVKDGEEINVLVSADSTQVVTFTNTYNGNTSGSGGVTNHFTYQVENEKGCWNWEQTSDNTVTSNGMIDKFLMQIMNSLQGKTNE